MDLTKLTYDELLALRVKVNNVIAERDAVAHAALEKGEEVPGWTYKQGKLVRKITNEGAMADRLRSLGFTNKDIYSAKMISIPAMEKLLKSKGLEYNNIKPYISEVHAEPKPVYVGVEDV